MPIRLQQPVLTDLLVSWCGSLELSLSGTRVLNVRLPILQVLGVQIALSPQLLAMEGPLETAGRHQVALRLVAGGGTRPSLAVMVTDRRQPALRERAIHATPLSHAAESTQTAV